MLMKANEMKRNLWRSSNYGFLLSRIVLIGLFVLLPLLFNQYVLFNQSRQEAIRQNITHYEKTVQNFWQYYLHAAESIEENLYLIRAERKLSTSQISLRAYYKYEATRELAFYLRMVPFASRISLYFPTLDVVITNNYSYTLNQYLERFYPEGSSLRQPLSDLFRMSDQEKAAVLSSFSEKPVNEAELLFVFPFKAGVTAVNNSVMVYTATSQSLMVHYAGYADPTDYSAAIVDTEGNLFFASSSFDPSLLDSRALRSALPDETVSHMEAASENGGCHLFFKRWDEGGLTFIYSISQAVFEEDTVPYFIAMRRTMVAMIILVVCVCSIVFYLSYQPIRQLLSKIKFYGHPRPVGNEIDAIAGTIDQLYTDREEMQGIVSDQRLLLMEYVINNLMYGNPLPPERLSVLGNDLARKKFQVYVLKPFHPDSAGEEAFTSALNETPGLSAFVTSLPNERFTAVIAILDEHTSADQVHKKIRDLITEQCGDNITVGAGCAVEDINKLRESYHSALIQCEPFREEGERADESGALRQQLFYCIQAGQKAEANACIQRMRSLFTEKSSYLFSLYSCMQLISEYIGFVKKQNVPVDDDEILSLLTLDRPTELFERLQKNAETTCDLILKRNQDAEEKIKHSILAYLDENYQSASLSLTSAADHFGISIYFLSKYLKDQTGMGFREYINLRRTELAQQLLLSTEYPVSRIAAECGFETASYFNTWFRNNHGISPAAYRSQRRARD